MTIQSLAKESSIELAVNGAGQAILLHMGPLKREYSWVQFDDHFPALQLVTSEGDVQELGLIVPPAIRDVLHKTQQISLMSIDAQYRCNDMVVIKFNNVLN